MMIRLAGNTGLVSPIDFTARKTPLAKWVWYAVAASVMVHTGAGFWLYNQRFVINKPIEVAEPTATTVYLERPSLKPEPRLDPNPPAASPPLNRPENLYPSTVETLAAPPAPVTSSNPGLVLNISDPAPEISTGTAVTSTPALVGPPVITEPNWVRKPTGEQMLRAYPPRALERDMTGLATLSCMVRVDGSLTGCAISNETPASAGFGRSALRLSRYFQLSPRTVDGQAIDGAKVNVTIRFNLD